MKKSILIVISLAALTVTGCHGMGFGCRNFGGVRGNGQVKQETRNVGDFTAIEASGAVDIDIVCGESTKLDISAESNLLPYLKTEVEGKTLHIYTKKSVNARKKIRVQISVPNIEQISTSGANNITIKNINNDNFTVEASGAGKLKAVGKSKSLRLDLSGAVKIDARDLLTENADVDISGASKADVNVTEDLKAEISGVGSVDYFGNPKKVKQDISGVGSLNQR